MILHGDFRGVNRDLSVWDHVGIGIDGKPNKKPKENVPMRMIGNLVRVSVLGRKDPV